MYVPAYGLVRNSSYVPEKFLNSARAVVVDEYLKVKGADSVWALGDITNVENMQYMPCTNQTTYVAKSIVSILKSKTPTAVYKHFPMGTRPSDTTIKLLLTFCSGPRSSDWQEGRNRVFQRLEDTIFYHSLPAEEPVYRETGSHCLWFDVLSVVDTFGRRLDRERVIAIITEDFGCSGLNR